jgi:hypothetical protein
MSHEVNCRLTLEYFMSRCSLIVEQPKCNRPMERANPPAGSNTSRILSRPEFRLLLDNSKVPDA